MQRRTTEDFIKQATTIYGNKYDYSKVDYKANNKKIKIKCIQHDTWFEQSPSNHYIKEGCPICFADKQRKKFVKSSEIFIKEAKEKHNGFYDYSKTEYRDILHRVLITCPLHGDFEQHPTNHLRGCGCPKCGIDKIPGGYFSGFFEKYPEKKNVPATLYFIKFTRDNFTFYKIGLTSQDVETRYASKEYNSYKMEIIWEINMNLYSVWVWEQVLLNLLTPYKITLPWDFTGKTECISIEIPKPTNLIPIFEHEWKTKKEIIKSRINIKNNINPNKIKKIQGRKTEIKEVDSTIVKDFLETNHIQGYVYSEKSIGLYYQNELVSIMTFGKPRYSKEHDWELLRFCNSLNTIVMGGASKLFNFFKKNYPGSIISYSDNRWNTGNIYTQIGMKFSHTTSSNYWYTKGDLVLSRVKCQKHKLAKLLGPNNFDPNKTELENMKCNGFSKICDAGNSVYININTEETEIPTNLEMTLVGQ